MCYRILTAEYQEHIKTFSAFLGPHRSSRGRLNLILTVTVAANAKSFVNTVTTDSGELISCTAISDLVSGRPTLYPWITCEKITFLLEQESLDPDCSQCGDDCCANDLPRLQVGAVRVDLPPALLQVQQDHLLIHLQSTLNTDTHTHRNMSRLLLIKSQQNFTVQINILMFHLWTNKDFVYLHISCCSSYSIFNK